MANKPIGYTLHERNVFQGKGGERKLVPMQVAHATGRRRIDFRTFCARVAKSTTFNEQEVAAVLNYATEIAKDLVSNGESVEFGDLGTLTPSFKSQVVPLGEEFIPRQHISKAVVRLRPNARYFNIDGEVSYERVEAKAKKSKPSETSSGSKPSGGTPSGAADHAGV